MTNFTDEELCILAIILDVEIEQSNLKKRKWVHEAWKNRDSEGEFLTLYKELIEVIQHFILANMFN